MRTDIKLLKEVETRVDQEAAENDQTTKTEEVPLNVTLQCLEANELGDGILYAILHKDIFVFVKNMEVWFRWAGNFWQPDDLDLAVAAVENVALQYAKAIEELGKKLATALGDNNSELAERIQKTIGKLYKRIKKLRSENGRKSCLKFAHTNPTNPLAVHSRKFDSHPWLLACNNGVINLKTGECSPGKQSQYITKHCSVNWEGIDADKDAWLTALNVIFENNQEMISFLQRLYGYGITGVVEEHVFPVHYGVGRNGKGLIVEQISRVTGDHSGAIPSEMLLGSNTQSGGSGISPEIMVLKARRLAIASETDEGRRFSAAKVKWLTGGDTLTARLPYDKTLTEFAPSHLLVLLTNHRPEAPGNDFAFWERCFLIHHKIKFVNRKPSAVNEREADKKLYYKLHKCGPGILAWLVEGCLSWQQQGLNPPEVVTKATKDYQEDEDILGQFLDAVCEFDDSYKATAKDLHTAFKTWYTANINENERFIPSQKKFGTRLLATERFERRKSGGYIRYFGLRIKSSYKSPVV